MICGAKSSKLTGKEKEVELSEIMLPKQFSYKDVMSAVLDQKQTYKCVAYSAANILNFYVKIKEVENKDYTKVIDQIYKSRSNSSDDGMSIKEALQFIYSNYKKDYAKISSIEHLKRAIIAYGPCFGALPCYNSDDEFWKGSGNVGRHCVIIVGLDEDGFIIMNSWGKNWSEGGFGYIDYKDFNNFKELWTLI